MTIRIYTDFGVQYIERESYSAPAAKLKVQCSNLARFGDWPMRPSSLAAQQENRLLAEKIPEPPGRIEPQWRAPGIKRHRPLHLDPNFGAEPAKILDGAMVDIGRVVP